MLDAEIFRLRPETRVEEALAAMETAARLGARHLLVAGNDPDESRLTESFGQFCDTASRFGLGAVLEFMPWTDARDLEQAARIVDAAGRLNGGVLIDAFHLHRADSRIEDVARLPESLLPYVQLCDAPMAPPDDMAGIIREARSERLFPGEGGIDLLGLLRVLPRDIPLSLEIPTHRLARTVGALDRARRARASTEALLLALEER